MRILIVRPLADAERTAVALQAAGYVPVVAPVLRIVPTGIPAPERPVDAAVLTSTNAVPALASLPKAVRLPVFAVGVRTGAAARAAGLTVAGIGSGTGEDLAAIVQRTLPGGATLLHVAGRDRKGEPGRSLEADGFRVVVWESYAAEPVPFLPEAAARELRASTLDAVLHYSERSATVLLALTRLAGLEPALTATTHLCLSAEIAAPLRAAGAPNVLVAGRPNEDSLLDALRAVGQA